MLRRMNDKRGPAPRPEPGPEPGPEPEAISVPVAARTLGISERAVRKRINAGTLRAEPFGRSFRVWLPEDAPPAVPEPGPVQGPEPTAGPAPRPEPGPEPIEAIYRVTPAEVEQAIERTGAKYVADMASLYDRISTELGKVYEGQLAAKDQTITTQAETIDELRRRAAVAEAERDRLAAAQATPALPSATEIPAAAQGDAPGVWGWLRRWWGGGA